MEIKVTEEEVNDLLSLVSEIPTKYGIAIVNRIQSIWNKKISESKEKVQEPKIDQK